MSNNNAVAKARGLIGDVRTYWKVPMPGRYMNFREIAAYAGGGIGAYFIITMGSLLIVSTNNMIVSASIGVDPTHMYILYLISTLANIPLTALRAIRKRRINYENQKLLYHVPYF